MLSVCMIVKNEQENLPGCLDSLKPLGDFQLVVVDTGSTDRTMEIAKAYGAEVYEHPWEDDFAKARNQSYAYATGDWILCIDADERIHTGGEHIKAMLAEIEGRDDIGGGVVLMEDMSADSEVQCSWLTIRFSKRSHNPVWHSAFHNQLIHEGEHALLKGVTFRHYGYKDRKVLAEKIARTKKIILRDLEERPEKKRGYFYLAHQAAQQEQWQEAVDFAETYLKLASQNGNEYNESIHHLGVQCSMMLNDKDLVDSWLTRAIQALPYDMDIAYDTVLYGSATKRDDLIIQGAQRYLKAWETWEEALERQDNRWCYTRTPVYYEKVVTTAKDALSREVAEMEKRLAELTA